MLYISPVSRPEPNILLNISPVSSPEPNITKAKPWTNGILICQVFIYDTSYLSTSQLFQGCIHLQTQVDVKFFNLKNTVQKKTLTRFEPTSTVDDAIKWKDIDGAGISEIACINAAEKQGNISYTCIFKFTNTEIY